MSKFLMFKNVNVKENVRKSKLKLRLYLSFQAIAA